MRIVGGWRVKVYGLGAAAFRGHAKGFSFLFGQCGIHLRYPLLDLKGERVPTPTELHTHNTAILDRVTFGHPPLPHQVIQHVTHCRHPHD